MAQVRGRIGPGRADRGDDRPAGRRGRLETKMKKIAIVFGALVLVLAAASLVRPVQTADKLPKCSGQLCQKSGCSADTLCVRGASVVTCADVCGGH
jgi:hypothetical protein